MQSVHKKSTSTEQKSEKPIPKKYRALLDKYPSILKPDFKAKQVKHGIVHVIETGTNRPCTTKVRPLMPGTEKTKLIEKSWRELEELGITVKVDPAEVNTWTSALNIVPKPDGTLRVCPDYRPLNDRTLLDGYPLPNLRHFTS